MSANTLFIVVAILFVVILLITISRKDYYSDKHPILDEIRKRFGVLNATYTKIPLRLGSKSFTEDKSVITLCITDPQSKKYYDMNTLMYVALHELAHVLSKSEGHEEEFKDNFAKLLKKAAEKDIYDPTQSIPLTYCGTGSESH